MGPLIVIIAFVLSIESNVHFTLAKSVNGDNAGISNREYTLPICDIYRDAWKDNKEEEWVVGNDIKSGTFCTSSPVWEQPEPFKPICNKDWPIRVLFYDGSKYPNGTKKTCTVNMAESKHSANTKECIHTAVHGFGEVETPLDWIVYLSGGFNARILWYHDFAEALINRYKKSNRRVVVAMIYWEEMANNPYPKQWYDDQIQSDITGSRMNNTKAESRSDDELPSSNALMQLLSCQLTPYKQAATNVPVVGNVVGELVKSIKIHAKEKEYTTFCMGHSLGAHSCGFIGKSSKLVDKIFAFDPAGPSYDHHPAKYRLDKGDATVVHVLHTSTAFLGLEDPIGDVDFYPNGLWDNQPVTCPNADKIQCGCPVEVTDVPWFYNNQDCSHEWGIEFLIRLWEKNTKTWHCNSNVYCTSVYRSFPTTSRIRHLVTDKNGQKTMSVDNSWWNNKCFLGDNVQVGNLEEMEKNENGIRWFETESPEMCQYSNTVRHLRTWLQEFKPNVPIEKCFTSA